MTALDTPSNTPTPTGAKIAIGDLLSRSLGSTFGNLGTAFSLAVMPLLLLLAAALASSVIMADSLISLSSQMSSTAPQLSATQVVGMIVAYLLIFAVYILFYVAWTRFVLKGERGLLCSSLHRWRRPHWVTLGKGILLFLLFLLVAIAFNIVHAIVMWASAAIGSPEVTLGLSILGAIVIWVAIMAVMLRFSYVLPAAAVGHPYGFAQSWRDTRGQGFRLFLTAFLLGLIVLAIQIALVVGIGLVGTLIAALFGSASSLMDPQSILPLIAGGGAVVVIIPLYFFFLMLSFVLQTPMINMLAHGFKTGSGWQNDDDLAERFS